MISFPGAGRGPGQQSSPYSCFVLFQLFSVFFNFFSFFLKLSCGFDVFMFLGRQRDNPVPSCGNVISLLERTKNCHSVFGN